MGTADEGTVHRLGAAAHRRMMLRRIDAALARIEAGEYGWCTVCGEQIPATRLDREPTAVHCAACAGVARSRGR